MSAVQLEQIDRRTCVIINPAASSGGAASRWPAIRDALRRRFTDLTIAETERPGHATELCRGALEDGAEFILSVGGDGTNNEVLWGFCDEQGNNRFPDAVLGLIAAGTGGDFQRQFGALRPAKQVERMFKADVRSIDYGVVTYRDHQGRDVTRPFLNTFSAGISGLVVDYVDGASRALGPQAAYLGSSLKGIANYKNKQVLIGVDGEQPRRLDLTLLVVSNGKYFGAGMQACPHAVLDDGALAWVMLERMRRAAIVHTLVRAYQGKHLRIKNVSHGHAQTMNLALPEGSHARVLIELDGEQPGTLPAQLSVRPRGIKIKIA